MRRAQIITNTLGIRFFKYFIDFFEMMLTHLGNTDLNYTTEKWVIQMRESSIPHPRAPEMNAGRM